LLRDQVARFLDHPDPGSFQSLALAAFTHQYRNVEAYRRLCDARGLLPGSIHTWQEIPLVPAAAFKTVPLAAGPTRITFRSSGTTRGSRHRSVHFQPFPDLYRKVIDLSFPGPCLPGPAPVPILALVPPLRHAPDSSLSFMVDHILSRFGSPTSETAFGLRGVCSEDATAWVEAAAERGEPVLVLSTAFALLHWLDHLEAQRKTLRLPEGSTLFETGGFKGRSREITRPELLSQVEKTLGVPPQRIVREYGMTELSSQFYTHVLAGEDEDLFHGPPWTRVRILDPETLDEAPEGSPGLITVLDLANLGSALHVMTEDLGVAEGPGFRLLGRAAGADLRGCSLTVEELAR